MMKNKITDALLPHQLESSTVTQDELDFIQRWLKALSEETLTDTWLDQWLGISYPFSFRYGDRESSEVMGKWLIQKADTKTDADIEHYELIWIDESTGLRLVWHIKRFMDFPAVEWLITLVNNGTDDTPIIESIQALDIRLNSQKNYPYTIHGVSGGRSFPDDMIPFSWRVPSFDGKSDVQLGGDYPSSNRHLPFFNIEAPDDRGLLIGIGWSGNWLARVKAEGTDLKVYAGMTESHLILHPGEKIRTPSVLMLFWKGKPLHGHNMLRQLLHRKYVPELKGSPQKPLVSVNACFTYHGRGGFLHQATEKEILQLVKPFIKIGAELFIIDAGWYEGEPWHEWIGNWRYSEEKYPHGFRPISDPLAAAGIPFGLWFASEGISSHSPLLQEHPEWVRKGTLRMELPEAREWFLKQVDNLVKNDGMTCYRQDGAGGFGSEDADRKGITECQHIEGLYAMWDAIIRHYPEMVMEGCCGGGRRIDLETLSRFHWHRKSDRWYDSESDQCSLYGANLYLPGGVINIPTELTDDYGVWSSFAGQLCLGWHPLDDDFPMELAHQQVERYKLIRPLLSGDFYPLTPCSLIEPWIGYQFHRSDLDKGFALLFRRPVSKDIFYPVNDAFRLRLRGLKPEERYSVCLEKGNMNEILTGSDLAKGIDVIISEERGAEMIIYEPSNKL